MGSRFEEFKKNIQHKNIAVVGLGISNVPLIKFLTKFDVRITAFDKAEESQLQHTIMELSKYGNIHYSLGKDYLKQLVGFDIIYKTPSVRFDIPELKEERKYGAIISSEMELFMELCPAKVIGITGSDGKTTTTTIIYNILKETGYNCWLGGNIGTPLIDRVESINEKDWVVLELSSFQLHTMKQSPNITVITNITPNHLDIHKSMEEYIDAKKNSFLYQEKNDLVILNYDNPITQSFGNETIGHTRFFSRLHELNHGCFIRDGVLTFADGEGERDIVPIEDIKIPGMHNVENYLAAVAATADIVSADTVKKVATTFAGVEHRREFVREINGIKFYNDSIGTSPTRTIATLNSFYKRVILIAGGYDKRIPYDIMGETLIKKTKAIIILGQTGILIEKALRDEMYDSNNYPDIPVFRVDNLEEAVDKAVEIAQNEDTVILSPASASFDMFKNFEERGDKFKEIVNSL